MRRSCEPSSRWDTTWGFGIVAEGVSSEAQLEFLRAEGCDAVQGWLMSAAVPCE